MRRGSRHPRVLPTTTAGALVVAALTLLLPSSAGAAGPSPARPFDLDGDGYAELVVGIPGESRGPTARTGAVSILPGSASGATATGDRLLEQDTPGIAGANETGDRFGSAVASGDFDRDGYADLAVGVSGENTAADGGSPADGVGSVAVLYGSPTGVTGTGDQRFTSQSVGQREAWGARLEVGDLNGDGYLDLVSARGATAGPEYTNGVTILYGSPSGLVTTGAVHLTEAQAGAPGPGATPESFGRAVAVGDVTGDGIDDLAVSTARGSTPGVYLFGGRSSGLATAADQFISQDAMELALPGVEYASLGDRLVIGDFDGEGHGDLALADTDAGPPTSPDCTAHANCPGAVLVLPGTASGLDVSRRRLWYEDAPGLPGSGGSAFGWGLAAGDIDADGRDDLAIGMLGHTVRGALYTGAVEVVHGSAAGLSAARAQQWSQETAGVPGAPEAGDTFGADVRVSQIGRSRGADLAVWSRGESIGAVPAAGSVTVLYGWVGLGARAAGSKDWNQGSVGVLGKPEADDRYGVLRREE